MYVDYIYYSQTYQGKVKEENFTPLSIKAQALVDYYTFNRIKNVTEKVRFAVCELVDVINQKEINDTKGIQSEKVGSYSVTYASAEEIKAQYNQDVKRILYKYLPSELLFRGIRATMPIDFEEGG